MLTRLILTTYYWWCLYHLEKRGERGKKWRLSANIELCTLWHDIGNWINRKQSDSINVDLWGHLILMNNHFYFLYGFACVFYDTLGIPWVAIGQSVDECLIFTYNHQIGFTPSNRWRNDMFTNYSWFLHLNLWGTAAKVSTHQHASVNKVTSAAKCFRREQQRWLTSPVPTNVSFKSNDPCNNKIDWSPRPETTGNYSVGHVTRWIWLIDATQNAMWSFL